MYLANGNSDTVIIPSIPDTHLMTDSMPNEAHCVLTFSITKYRSQVDDDQ